MSNNTKYGVSSLDNNVGSDNTAVGAYSAYNNLDGDKNTAVGSNSSFYNTSGTDNTALGAGSLCNNTTGNLNTAVGSSALEGALVSPEVGQSVGDHNVAIGAQALYSNSGNLNTAVGTFSALNNSDGESNTSIGFNTLFTNTSGSNNTALGTSSLFTNTSGSNNTALGSNSLFNLDASNNTAIGFESGISNLFGNYNTFLGSNADINSDSTIEYSTAIGYNAQVTESSQIMLGGTGPLGYPDVIIPGNGFLPNFTIHNVAPDQIVTKQYVDSVAQGLSPKPPCSCVANYDVTITQNGLPATITIQSGVDSTPPSYNTFNNLYTIDGYTPTPAVFGTVAGAESRVLINNQGTPDTSANILNGIFVLYGLGLPDPITGVPGGPYYFARSLDMATGEDALGAFCFIEYGDEYQVTSWVQSYTIDNAGTPVFVGTDPLLFVKYSSSFFNLGRGLSTYNNNTQIFVSIDTSLNFIDYLDSTEGAIQEGGQTGGSGTLNIGNSTNQTIIGPTGAVRNPVIFTSGITGPTGSFTYLSSTNNTYLATTSGSNVGIGTFTPRVPLEINANQIIYRSNVWSQQTQVNPPIGNQTWQSVCYGNGIFIAVASTGYGIISQDGINWNTRNYGHSWTSICYGNGLFVAVCGSNNFIVFTSLDGLNWAQNSINMNPNSVCYGNGLYVGVGGQVNAPIAISQDGKTWTNIAGPSPAIITTYNEVCYGNGLFVAVSANGQIITSPNGINWTYITTAPSGQLGSVCYGNGLFVAVGNNAIITSPNGTTWTSRTSPAASYWSSIKYGNGLFVSCASGGTNNQVMTSPDGITWTLPPSSSTTALGDWQSICYGNGLFVAVGSNGIIMTSGKQDETIQRTVIAWDLSGNDIFYNLGNVGLGTVNPQYTLDVNGVIHTNNNLLVDGNTTLGNTLTDTTVVNGSLGVNTTAASGFALDVSGNANVEGSLNVGAGPQSSNAAINLYSVDGAYSGGISIFTAPNSSSVIGVPVLTLAPEGNRYFAYDTGHYGVNGFSNVLVFDSSSSNVGFSNSSPQYTIDVSGNARITQGITGATGSFTNVYASGNILASGNVGIQNLNPGNTLDVSGNLNVDGFMNGVINNPGFNFLPLDISSNFAQNWSLVTSFSGIVFTSVSSSASGQYQTAVGSFSVGSGGNIYISNNYGVTWSISPASSVNYSSVAVSASGQYQTAVGNVGTLPGPITGNIYISNNYGVSWMLATTSSSYVFTDVAVSASGQYQNASNTIGSSSNIYTLYSTNYGVTWSQSSPFSTAGINTSIAISSSGQYQTVSRHYDGIYYSTNYGVDWKPSSLTIAPNIVFFYSVSTSASGQYQVATVVSGGTVVGIYYSTNYGANWTQSFAPLQDYRDVSVSASGQYQVVTAYNGGTNGNIYYSTDYGVNWTQASPTITDGFVSVSISASGQYITAVTTSGRIYTSVLPVNNLPVTSLTVSGVLNVLGNSYLGNSSTDTTVVNGYLGINTSTPAFPLDVSGNINIRNYYTDVSGGILNNGIYFNDGTFQNTGYVDTHFCVAGGDAGTCVLAYSYDGINWLTSPNGSSLLTSCNGIGWNSNIWVAGGIGTNPLIYSINGITWTASTNGSSLSISSIIDIAWGDIMWVATALLTSGSYQIFYSYDGQNWYASANGSTLLTTIPVNGLAYGNNKWIITYQVTNYIQYLYSYDGINWYNAQIGGYEQLVYSSAIGFGNNMWILGCHTYSGSSITAIQHYYSYDGINWLPSAPVNFGAGQVNVQCLKWNGNYWLDVVGGGSGVPDSAHLSYDGINWTTVTNLYTDNQVDGLAWNDKYWLVGASRKNNNTNVMIYAYDSSSNPTDPLTILASSSGNKLFGNTVNSIGCNCITSKTILPNVNPSVQKYNWNLDQSGNFYIQQNVGIGSNYPQYKLDVLGNSNVTGKMTITQPAPNTTSNYTTFDSSYNSQGVNGNNFRISLPGTSSQLATTWITQSTGTGSPYGLNIVPSYIYTGQGTFGWSFDASAVTFDVPNIGRLYLNENTFINGNLGINMGGSTTSTSYTLDVSGNINTNSNISITPLTADASNSFIYFNTSGTTTDWAKIIWHSSADTDSYLQIGTYDNANTSGNEEPIYFTQEDFGNTITYVRMKINDTGVYINPTNAISPNPFTAVPSSSYQLNVNGSVYATTFNTPSDYRIKENVKILDESFTVDELKPVSFFNKKTEKQDMGLIAHELQEVYPFLVNGEKDGEEHQSVNYTSLIAILIKEIKELKQRVKTLEERN
jgi:hypothetical protein